MQALLASETDLAGFRAEARSLLAQQVPPEQVHWQTAQAQNADLFGDAPAVAAPARGTGAGGAAQPSRAATAIVPASFLRLCEQVVLHRDPQRFALMYRLLWRLVHEPQLRFDPVDADMLLAQHMAQSVRRDMHKLKAFVRFRPVPDEERPGELLHVAWFEPQHHIVQAVAPWFAQRFATLHWAILTPEVSVEHTPGAGGAPADLRIGPGARREDAPPPDAGEQLWLTYYRSIFNPARLKLKAMAREMPRRYWANLPEAQLIAPLADAARERTGQMIEQPATQPRRRLPQAPQRAVAPIVPTMPATPGGTGTGAGAAWPDAGITSLEQLKAATMACRECPIGEHATQSVIGQGPLGAALMLVGEQPGDQEDIRGAPFVGPAGQLLHRALAQAGIDAGHAFLSNAVRHFKYELRGKRRIHKTPTQREAAACLHWLEDEIALVRPQALVALGATAARALLGRPVAVTTERGRWHLRPDGLQVLVTLHPSALLRMPPELQDGAFEAFVADLRLAAQGVAADAPAG